MREPWQAHPAGAARSVTVGSKDLAKTFSPCSETLSDGAADEYHRCPCSYSHTHTWFESVVQVGHQVVLLEHQLPVQVGDGQIGQRAQTLDHKLLCLLLTDLSCQIPDVVLPAHTHTHISTSMRDLNEG